MQTAALLEVPAERRSVLRPHRCVVGGAGAVQRAAHAATGAAATTERRRRRASPADFAEEAGSARFVPYYSMFRAPGQDEPSFQLLRPFVPFSTDDNRTELQAFMLASSDPGDLRATDHVRRRRPRTSTDRSRSTAPSSRTRRSRPRSRCSTRATRGAVRRHADGPHRRRPAVPAAAVRAVGQRRRRRRTSTSWRPTTATPCSASTIEEALAKLFPGFRTDIGDVVGEGEDPSIRMIRANRAEPSPNPVTTQLPTCWRRPTICSGRPTRRCPTSPGMPS